MTWQSLPYLYPIPLAMLLAISIAVWAWQHRPAPGASALSGMMLAVSLWLGGSYVEHSTPMLEVALVSVVVQTLAACSAPVFWLIFTIDYTGRRAWLSRLNRVLLAAFPLLVVTVTWINEFRYVQGASVHTEASLPFTYYHIELGNAWAVPDIIAALMVLAGTGLLTYALLRSRRVRRGQIFLFLLGVMPPTLLRLAYLGGVTANPPVDLTPVGLALTGACLAWGVMHYDFSSVVPVAREAIIAGLQDGVLVFDGHQRVVEINPAAQTVLGLDAEQVLGRPLNGSIKDPTGSLLPHLKRSEAHDQVVWGLPEGEPRWYDLRITSLTDRHGKTTGRMLVLRDIHAEKQNEEQLQASNDQLEYIVSERTQALRQANRLLEVRLTEREKAERALREAADQMVTLVDNFPGFVVLKDTQNVYRMASRMFLRAMGIEAHEIANKTDRDFYTPEQAAAERDADVRTILSGQSIYQGEAAWVIDGKELVLDRRKVPIKDEDGRVVGVMSLAYDITDRKRAEEALEQAKADLEVRVTERTAELRQANEQLEVELMERKRAEEQLRYMSMHDPMTGLYNRAYFEEELLRLASSRLYPISIIMADTDNLKVTNDRLGHPVGDELLRLTAVVLKSVFRSQDVVARIGGDEFCILMPETDAVVAQQSLERIRARVALNNLQRPDLPLGLSLGTFTAQRGDGLAEALKQADALMYENKKARRVGR